MDFYLLFKSLHIIGFVSWFAGLFYLPRLFINHVEVAVRPEAEKIILQKQFELMARRLYSIIMTPAMVFTWAMGTAMIVHNLMLDPSWLKYQGWLHLKLTLLIFLTGYHHHLKSLMKKLEKGTNTWSADRLRVWNEVATIFLVMIVLIAVYKDFLNFLYMFLGMLALGVALWMGIKFYKKVRKQ